LQKSPESILIAVRPSGSNYTYIYFLHDPQADAW